MENHFQRVVAFLLSVLLFFIFPIYVTYEKKDDLSHAMASKITHLFVDNVRNKGYVSPKMFDEFNKLLTMTGNQYDIEMEHYKKRYDPVVYIYGVRNGKVVVVDEMTTEYYDTNINGADNFSYRGKNYAKYLSSQTGGYMSGEIPGVTVETIKKTAKISREVFHDATIRNKIFPKYMYKIMTDDGKNLEMPSKESVVRKYMLAVGDNFNVKIRNKNTTLATVIFYTITSQKQQYGVPKIYISYGGVVRNQLINEVITSNEGFANQGENLPDVDDTIVNPGGDVEVTPSLEVGASKEFEYKGSPEIFELTRGIYRLEAWGAEGGGVIGSSIKGGRGGHVDALIEIREPSKLIDIRVGGKGGDAGAGNSGATSTVKLNGGYNGGGNGSGVGGAGGGGASEIRLGGEGTEFRIRVAAGGGGNTLSSGKTDEAAGGLEHTNYVLTPFGENGCINSHVEGYGNDECGGGAGYFGGKTVHGDDAKFAYGGTNFIDEDALQKHANESGVQTGNGKIIITRLR